MSNEGKILDVDDESTKRNFVETGVARKRGSKTLNLILGSLAGLVCFGVLSYYILGSDNSVDESLADITVKKDEALINAENSSNTLAAQMAAIKKQQEEEERLRREAEEAERLRKLKEQQAQEQEAAQEAAIQARINDQPIPEQGFSQEPVETPAIRRLKGSSMLILEGNGRNSDGGEIDPNGINNKLSGDVYANGAAKIVRGRELLLIHGTQIPCVLQTRLVTDHPSILICQVTKNIYSADGSTLLIERGSKVFGEQKTAIITGQSLAFVSWSEIDTPYGLRIRVDSLGTDPLGAAGVGVWVDEKWGKRFGGAILLSFIQDALKTGSKKITNTEIVYDNSEQNANRMAEIALENSINIQPTGYALQGTQVNILIARDIDFSNVYRLK